MRSKTIAFAAIFVLCLVFFTACQSTTIDEQSTTMDEQSTTMDEQSPLYKSSAVTVSLVNSADEIQYTYYEWASLTDDIAYTKNTVILTGVASNVRQATVSYVYMDVNVSDNITIFDIEVAEVLSCRSGSFQQGDLVTVGVGYNMNTYGEGLPIIEEGNSYMAFCYVAADRENDVLELAEYVDCWINAPKDLFLEKIGNYYLSVDYFADVPGSLHLADFFSLTEEQITALSAIKSTDKNAVRTYMDKEIVPGFASELTEAAEALLVLKTRTMEHSTELQILTNRSYLIRCDDLEEYVRNTALTYNL